MFFVRKPSNERLGALLAEASRSEPTYVDVGGTRSSSPPPGYHLDRHRIVLGSGPDVDGHAREGLRRWEPHRHAGAEVFPRAAPLEKDQTVLVVVRVALTIAVAPCRIVRTVDEPGRFGFAYSTLPGHPEEGEEAFLIETDDTGTVAFNVEAISRPAALVAKLGAPVSRMVQRRTATRYLEGLAHYVNAHS